MSDASSSGGAPIRVATRGSDLALAQSRHTAARIEKALGRPCELVVVTTTGDRVQDVSLAKIGGKGLFVKEIEEALLEGRADVAVHSAKDLPAVLAPGCRLAVFPERADPRDALCGREAGVTLDSLPRGARVGTGSTRRIALIRERRPDLELVPLRGNVPTRLEKIETERLDAVVLACAGLDRLGLADRITERIPTDVLLPAVCQGMLALETREDDPLAAALGELTDLAHAPAVRAERAFLLTLEGDCTVPLAAHGERVGQDGLRLRGLVSNATGDRVVRFEAEGTVDEAESLGRRVAERVLEDGGAEILKALREAGSEVEAPGTPPARGAGRSDD